MHKDFPGLLFSSHFSSVAQSCPNLCNPMDCSMPGFPVHHQLPEFAQTHVHWVGGAIQPSHPLSSPSPPAFNLSQHQGLFQWVSSSHQVAKYWSFRFSVSPSDEYSGLISLTKHQLAKISHMTEPRNRGGGAMQSTYHNSKTIFHKN